MWIKKSLPLLFLIGLAAFNASAFENDVKKSTTPIGSHFYRHLAFDSGINMKKLARYEKRGFGRSEIITLILLSQITGAPLKDYGNRRLKKKASLKKMAEEAGLDYVTLYKVVQVLKKNIEAKDDQNLPPPVFDMNIDEKDEDE